MPDLEESSFGSDTEIEEHDKDPQSAPFPIVGIGASAGGLEAFTQLLTALPVTTGMAFVLVQHLDPAHESQLTQILSRATAMPVYQVIDGMAIHPNSIYIIPPNATLTVVRGALRLAPRALDHAAHLPIDCFFESLAEQQGRLAIGVILSGNGSDGSQGLKAVKSRCGFTFVQNEQTAKFGGMPHSAIATGAADFVLPPAQIAHELARISAHPYVLLAPPGGTRELLPEGESELRKIFALVQRSTGVDFRQYKQTTTRRRIGRRMIVHRSQTLGEYLAHLERHPEEIQELYRDLVISVTHFFRNPESFLALATHLGAALRSRQSSDSFRVWVPGCATGEEVYSLAICLHELFVQTGVRPALQLFGTDISELALGKARTGRYDESIAQDVSPERLHQYFQKIDGRYQIAKSIRDCCIFAKQDLTHDPPFSRVDLVSCRNTLIYLDQALQKSVVPIFHYSLNEGGLLFLGPAETIGAAEDLFQTLDRKHKIYTRTSAATRFSVSSAPARSPIDPLSVRYVPSPVHQDWHKQADQLIQNRYAPDGVIINQDLTVLQVRGRTGFYLQPAAPGTSQNLLLLAREMLQFPIREAVLTAMAQNIPVQRKNLRLEHQGDERQINLEVIPISPASATERFYFVVFEHTNAPPHAPGNEPPLSPSEPETHEQENRRLRQQLAESHDYLRTLTEEHEAALEEQKASNEEISSANEELQSTNEELSTAKEELQSANEELTTVNEELQNRNQELDVLLNDLNNVFASVNTPILIFDRGLCLRRFTPAAEWSLGVGPADLGRPISDLPIRTSLPQLEQLVRGVVDTLAVATREIQDHSGNWWSLAIRPYRTLDHRIEGAVLTFADVNTLKRSLRVAEEARDYAEGIFQTVRDPLLVLTPSLHIERANNAFYRMFQIAAEDTDGRLIYELDGHQWNLEPLRHLLEGVLPKSSFFEDFAMEHEFSRIGPRNLSLNARGISHDDHSLDRILLAIEDVTARKLAEQPLIRSYADLEQFSYVVAHDLQEPLRSVGSYSDLLVRRYQGKIDSESDRMLHFLMDGVTRMQNMIGDLLAYSQAGVRDDSLLEPVSAEAALEEALLSLQVAVKESAASVTHGDLPVIRYAGTQLTQILQNLIGNSIKYRGESPPQIHVSAVREASEWVFSVRDNGIGFDQRQAQAIFGVFKRLDHRQAGTGIGLAICQRIAERFGGRIWAKSEPGLGSTFFFTIPVLEAGAHASNQS
jgi:two-component system CheB/CheR fusion protein